MVTLKEIAERCGCSAATVSKALNGKQDINTDTGNMIRAVAREMGYMPNMAARTLKTNRSKIIGLLWFLGSESVWTHDHFGRIAYGIQAGAEKKGYDVTPVVCTPKNLEGRYLDYCRTRGYDGIVVMNAGLVDESLMELVNSDIPLVTIDFTFPQRSSVVSDQGEGVEALVRAAWQQGHRRIAYIHGEDYSEVTDTRKAHFLKACAELGVDVPPEYMRDAVYRDETVAAAATRELMALPNPPTCILYPDDLPAAAGCRALRQLGYEVPRDVSVIGYDGVPMAARLTPRLTTYAQPAFEMGQAVAELLLRQVEQKDAVPEHRVIPGNVVAGETLAAPRG